MLIDITIVAIYAIGILMVGAYSMRRAKNSEEYLVAGRSLGTFMYLGALSATILGGAATIGTVSLGYRYGISGFWLAGSLGLGVIVLNVFLAKHLIKLKIFTVTQVLELRYNTIVRNISALIMIVNTSMVSVVSILGMGTILKVFFGLDLWQGVLLAGGIVLIYSVIGGMWSITLTDIIQFIIQTVGLMFIMLPIAIYKAGGMEEFVAQVPATGFKLDTIGIGMITTYFLIYFFGVIIGQDIWQRVFTARDEKVAQRGGFLAGVYCIIYGLVCALIGMAGKIILPELANSNDAFAAMLQNVLPIGIRGIVLAAALSALMSTASGGLLAASTTLTEDIFPIFKRMRAKYRSNGMDEASERESNLLFNRIATAAVGATVLGLSLLFDDVLTALAFAYNLLVGGMLIPLIGAIYWKRATTQGAVAAMTLGFSAVAFFIYKDGIDANSPIYYGLLVSIITFIGVSLATYRKETSTPTIESLLEQK